jgi:hypothetical protein
MPILLIGKKLQILLRLRPEITKPEIKPLWPMPRPTLLLLQQLPMLPQPPQLQPPPSLVVGPEMLPMPKMLIMLWTIRRTWNLIIGSI